MQLMNVKVNTWALYIHLYLDSRDFEIDERETGSSLSTVHAVQQEGSLKVHRAKSVFELPRCL